jgi:hypothetical protein
MLAVGLAPAVAEAGVVIEVTKSVLRSSEVVGTAGVVGATVDVGKVGEAEVTTVDDVSVDETEVDVVVVDVEEVDVGMALVLWPKHYIKDRVSR